jgi:hypothetical protein
MKDVKRSIASERKPQSEENESSNTIFIIHLGILMVFIGLYVFKIRGKHN